MPAPKKTVAPFWPQVARGQAHLVLAPVSTAEGVSEGVSTLEHLERAGVITPSSPRLTGPLRPLSSESLGCVGVCGSRCTNSAQFAREGAAGGKPEPDDANCARPPGRRGPRGPDGPARAKVAKTLDAF